MMIQERLEALRNKMKEYNIDLYYVPTADYHDSEYVADAFKARAYLSNFTGSAGVMVITLDEAGLWTDGRYFIQAEKQLQGTGVTLYRMGNAGVPTVKEYMEQQLQEGMCLGFDGRTVSASLAAAWEEMAAKKGAHLCWEHDLVGMIWNDRPALPQGTTYMLKEQYCGESAPHKWKRVREAMKEAGCSAHLLTSLDDIAWLLNIRGTDVPCNPVVLSYVVMTMDEVHLFVDEKKLSEEVKQELDRLHVTVHPYEAVYTFVGDLEDTVLYDGERVNTTLAHACKGKLVSMPNPEVLMKAIKNETEVENLRKCHIKDGVAVTKFIYWLKHTIAKQPITEWDAAEKLYQLREEQDNYLGPSFTTIGAYNANAAMMHYSPSKEHPVMMHPEGFYLVDSGGQYYEGTTDITRTIVLGPICEEWKQHYTRVVRGMIGVSKARFLYGCRGINLDILARSPLWDLDLDYRCGTGHGVGYLLNVHEAPNGFRWRIVPERNDSCVMEEGMVTTIEPGVYIENSHGIRVENELVCHKGEQNEYGQFMHFETITMAPIDLEAIDPDQMSADEKAFLNAYHARVYDTLAPYLNEEERAWLKQETRGV